MIDGRHDNFVVLSILLNVILEVTSGFSLATTQLMMPLPIPHAHGFRAAGLITLGAVVSCIIGEGGEALRGRLLTSHYAG